MGKLIVIWSPIIGQGGSSTVSSAIASLIALETNHKTLFTHSKKTSTVLDLMYKTTDNELTKNGMSGLERLIKSDMLNSHVIRDYSEMIYKDRLYYLQSGYNSEEDERTNARYLFQVLGEALKVFDLVIVNASADRDSIATKFLLKQADLLVVTLPQNAHAVDSFLEGHNVPAEINEVANKFIVITNFDDKAIYSIKNIQRKSKNQYPVFAFPYSTELKNAINISKLSDFYFRSLDSKKGTQVANLMNAIRTIKNAALEKLEYTERHLVSLGDANG